MEAIIDDLRNRAIDHDAEIKLLCDIGAFLDPDFVHFLAMRAGLRSHESLADDFLSGGFDGGDVFADFHSAGFAATARMDLGFYDPDGIAPLFGEILRRFFGAARDVSPLLIDETSLGNTDVRIFSEAVLPGTQ